MDYFNILIQGHKLTVSNSKAGFYKIRLKGNYLGYMELTNGGWVLQVDHFFTPFEVSLIAGEIVSHFQSAEFNPTLTHNYSLS